MDFVPIRDLFNLPPTIQEPPAEPGGPLGRDQFLHLLTTQLRFQDPLNPIANEEFTAQLAQFSALEQMEQINQNIESELLLAQSQHNAVATSMIGREVRVLSGQFAIPEEGDPPALFVQPGESSQVTLTILNEAGDTVRTLTVDAEGSEPVRIDWNGGDDQGEKLEPGRYRFEATSESSEAAEPLPLATFVQGKVSTIRFNGGVMQLLMTGVPYTLADVIEIRA